MVLYSLIKIQRSKQKLKVISIDTVGAGDTFTGYFLSEISKNKDIKTALLTATKAAAISVTRKGAIPSIPTIKEVEDFKD